MEEDLNGDRIRTSNSYRILGVENSPYQGQATLSPSQAYNNFGAQSLPNQLQTNYMGSGAQTDSFYSMGPGGANYGEAKLLKKSLLDTAFNERVKNASKNTHKLGSIKESFGNILRMSKSRAVFKSDSQNVQSPRQSSPSMSKNDSEASRALMKLKLNKSSKMLVQDQKSPTIMSRYLSIQPSSTNAVKMSARQISETAERNLLLNPSLKKLSIHEPIITMDHTSERVVPLIEEIMYVEKNYL